EEVIEPDLDHLNIRVAGGESVAAEETSGRNNKRPAVQPQIIVLDLYRPIGRERPLDARANQPTAVGVVVENADRGAGRCAGDGHAAVADPPAAGFAVNEPAVVGHPEPPSHGRNPAVVGTDLDRPNARDTNAAVCLVVVSNPIDVPFHAQHDIAELVIESRLDTAHD